MRFHPMPSKEIARKGFEAEKARYPDVKSRNEKLPCNKLRHIDVILVKYELYVQCLSHISAEEMIEGLRARGVVTTS